MSTLQYSAELLSAQRVAESHTRELRGLFNYIIDTREDGEEGGQQLDHSGLVQAVKKEIEKLKAQVHSTRMRRE